MNPTSTRAALDRAEALRSELDAMRPLDADRLGAAMQRLRIEWTYHSNAIEGNSLDYGETRALLMHGVTAAGKPLKDHLDITGHREALDYLERVVQDDDALTLAGIREMHQLLLGEPYEAWAETPDGQRVRRTITPGEFKTQPNHVTTATGETHYYARPEEVPAIMHDLVDYVRSAPDLNPVVFAADVHHRFAVIHPFDDGNGRMARLLMNLVLMRAGYPPAVIRQENRPAYYGVLAAADGGDLAPLVRFVSEELTATLELYLRALRGEPDPDVFSRRLGLLKREIETRGASVERSPEALRQATDRLFAPFMARLETGLRELDSFYLRTSMHDWYSGSDGHQRSATSDLGDRLREVEWISFNWVKNLSGHKSDPESNLSLVVTGSCRPNDVTLTVKPFGPSLAFTYDQIPSQAESLKIADDVLLSALDKTEEIARDAEAS